MDLGTVYNILGFIIMGALLYFVIRRVRKGGCCDHSHDRQNEQVQCFHSKSNTN